MKNLNPLLFLLLVFFGCTEKIEKKVQASEWHEINDELYFSNVTGEIGLKVYAPDNNFDTTEYRFLTSIYNGKKLKEIIDTSSFEYLGGGSFYRDKNQIYSHYEMADGGMFNVFKEDCDFEIEAIGDCYLKINDTIYSSRGGALSFADVNSFESKPGAGCFAKDSAHFYFWGDTISEAEFKEHLNYTTLNE